MVSGTPDAAEFGINADHRSMTKFSNVNSEDFKKVSRTLDFMIQKSGPKVEANWTLEARVKQGKQLYYSSAAYESKVVIFRRTGFYPQLASSFACKLRGGHWLRWFSNLARFCHFCLFQILNVDLHW